MALFLPDFLRRIRDLLHKSLIVTALYKDMPHTLNQRRHRSHEAQRVSYRHAESAVVVEDYSMHKALHENHASVLQ